MKAGAIVVNQCPLIKGVNDMPGVLGEMYQILERIGVPPYYLFRDAQPKATNPMRSHWSKAMKSLKKLDVFLRAWAESAVLHVPRYRQSRSLRIDEKFIYTRYQQAKDPENEFRFQVYHRDDRLLARPAQAGLWSLFYWSALSTSEKL